MKSTRFIYNGKVANTNKRHLQGAWNRGCRERQYVHVCLDFFYFFFVGHAKTVFLVNNQQTQLLEADVLGQQSVRTDNDVNFARAQIADDLLLLGTDAEAIQAGYT